MECIKIVKIEKQIIDLPPGMVANYTEAVVPPLTARAIPEGVGIGSVALEVKNIHYAHQRVRDRDGYSAHYLVPVDDQKLFRELVMVSDDVMNERLEEVKKEAWENGVRCAKEYVRLLPWWYRLFKRF